MLIIEWLGKWNALLLGELHLLHFQLVYKKPTKHLFVFVASFLLFLTVTKEENEFSMHLVFYLSFSVSL